MVVLKRSSKQVMKVPQVESIEEARNEYKKLLEEGWKKLISLKRKQTKKKDSHEPR